MESHTKWTYQSKRKYQEDRYTIIDTNYPKYYAVYDGHGGPTTSEYLKQCLGKKILKEINNNDSEQDINKKIIKIFKQTDRELLNKNTEDGSTCNIVIVFKDKLLFINLGDSRSVYFDPNGNLIYETKDHKPTTPSEKNRISGQGGQCSIQRSRGDVHRVYKNVRGGSTGLALTRAMGDFDLKGSEGADLCVSSVPTLTWIKRQAGFLLIGSDGIWDCEDFFKNKKEGFYEFISSIIKKEHSIENISKEVKKKCKPVHDNQTLIVVQLSNPETSKSESESEAYSSMINTILRAQQHKPYSTLRTLGTHSELFTTQ